MLKSIKIVSGMSIVRKAINSHSRLVLLCTMALAFSCSRADAVLVLKDDMNGHTSYATSWRDSADADPTGYVFPFGESPDSAVQILRAPTTAGSDGNAIPTMTGNPDDQYLHLARKAGDDAVVQINLTSDQQQKIAAGGTTRVEVDYYIDAQSPWDTGGAVRFDIQDHATSSGNQNDIIDLNFNKDGTVAVFIIQDDCCTLPSPFQHLTTYLPDLSAKFVTNEWQHLTVDMDMSTRRVEVTIDGSLGKGTVSGIPFTEEYEGGSAIPWDNFDVIRFLPLNGSRAAFDNLRVQSPIPEPSSVILVGLGLLGCTLRTRQRKLIK